VLAVLVMVPEASVYSNDGSMPWEDNVRAAWQAGYVQPEAASHPVENGPDLAFRYSVPTSNPGHVPASAIS
jgi:hypothetical protein